MKLPLVGNLDSKPILIVIQSDVDGRSGSRILASVIQKLAPSASRSNCGSAGSSAGSPRLTTEILRSGHLARVLLPCAMVYQRAYVGHFDSRPDFFTVQPGDAEEPRS